MSDLIDRRVAIDAICEDGTQRERQGQYSMTMVERKQRDVDILENLPSAQPDVPDTNVGDTISRQAAIESIQECADAAHSNHEWDMEQGYRNAIECIEEEPSAQPGWIPCSRELPKNKSYVLTIIYIPGRQAHIRSGWYEDGLFMNDNGDTWKATDKEVVGWMYQPKLPTPYREGGQE